MNSSDVILANFLGLVLISSYSKFRSYVMVFNSNRLVAFILHFTTILHELAHMIVALLMFSKIDKIEIIPKRYKDINAFGDEQIIWKLGGIDYSSYTKITALPIALAPLLLIFLAYYIFINWFSWFEVSYISIMSLYASVYLLSNSGIPSSDDFKGMFFYNSMFFWIVFGLFIYSFNKIGIFSAAYEVVITYVL